MTGHGQVIPLRDRQPDPADIYDHLRRAAERFAEAAEECRMLACLTRQRAGWDRSTGSKQPRLRGEELEMVRRALDDAIGEVTDARLSFDPEELDALREQVRAARADLRRVEEILESMP